MAKPPLSLWIELEMDIICPIIRSETFFTTVFTNPHKNQYCQRYGEHKGCSERSTRSSHHKEKEKRLASDTIDDTSPSRSRAKSSSYVPHRSPIPQSLNDPVEMLSLSEPQATSDTGHGLPPSSPSAIDKPRLSIIFGWHGYYFGVWVAPLSLPSIIDLLEEQQCLLGEGLAQGELRDEVYCQSMKQLNGNPNGILAISKKGPRIKPLAMAEIETASDAAFNPSTFGEPLDVTVRLQSATNHISSLPDDDPHVLASLLKLWSRKLCDPLMHEEMYKDCITHSHESETRIQLTVTKLTRTNSGAGDGTGLAEV
ncbi:hypothetical protein EV424DRAFT_1348940 [Suillus variegatus]|nr:hypothetical protein EV424DRAFT_1348940 [Suillus variegatus]